MRYRINFDKTINQLVPHYIGGRKLILYLQALMKPLQQVNDLFVEYAKEKRIEANMTSQTGYFEWYLNHKFGKYLDGGKITITNGFQLGVPIFWENATVAQQEHMSLYAGSEGRKGTVLYLQKDNTDVPTYSFVVNTPAVNLTMVSKATYLAMLTHCIDKYRIAGKTYKINYNA